MLLPNEPARHKLLDLLGDLSLLAEPGHVGVPVGHVVAYKAGHELHARFAKEVREAIKQGKATRVPAEMWAREEGGSAANDAEASSCGKAVLSMGPCIHAQKSSTECMCSKSNAKGAAVKLSPPSNGWWISEVLRLCAAS